MSTSTTDLTVRKTISVAAPVERAFEVFTERATSWWPVKSHSIGGDRVETVVFEGRAGGRVYERTTEGQESDWADIVVWEPPHRLILNWRVNPNKPATELELRFTPEGDGGSTRVDLEHRGWERLAEGAQEERTSYDAGWDKVLAAYVKRSSSR